MIENIKNQIRTSAAPTNAPELTLAGLRAAIDALKASVEPMKLVESRFIPEGISLLASRTQLAICNHETGKISVIDRPKVDRLFGAP